MKGETVTRRFLALCATLATVAVALPSVTAANEPPLQSCTHVWFTADYVRESVRGDQEVGRVTTTRHQTTYAVRSFTCHFSEAVRVTGRSQTQDTRRYRIDYAGGSRTVRVTLARYDIAQCASGTHRVGGTTDTCAPDKGLPSPYAKGLRRS
jgi:hypothetical protein